MNRPLSCLVAALVLVAAPDAFAQQSQVPLVTTPNGAKSEATTVKIRQIDILCQVLPLAIRKDQFNPLLTAIEFARSKQKQTKQMEDDELAKIDADVTEAVNNGLKKGAYPPKEVQVRAAKLYRTMSLRRTLVEAAIVDHTMEAIKKIFDAGQMKVMANSLDPYLMDPTIKKDSLDEDGKIRYYVEQILLDPVAYDILQKLNEVAS